MFLLSDDKIINPARRYSSPLTIKIRVNPVYIDIIVARKELKTEATPFIAQYQGMVLTE